jgi:hypothetical protein
MKTKIEQFIKRNQIRNLKLYQTGLIEGEDYVICPVSKQRMLIIRSDYITKVLEMSLDEYDQKYPATQRRCRAHTENIRKGLHRIDLKTGLTKYELGQVKARRILKSVDKDGISGYKRKGQKTRDTHMKNIDAFGRNGYQRQVIGRLTTVLPNGLTVEQNAHKKQKEKLLSQGISRVVGASKISKKILKSILDFLEEHNIKYYFDQSEYSIKDTDSGNCFFYDLTIPDHKITIEYQSHAWHADPTLSEEQWNSWNPPCGKRKTAQEVLEYDYMKAKALYKLRGIITYYIWESSRDTDVREILCLLKTLNMKS